jgi:selenocysteine lyase/cysteine desulfurase
LEGSGLIAWPEAKRAPHYLCLRSEGSLPEGMVEALGKERVYISLRGASLRITPHVYNSNEDVHRLIHILEQCFEAARR